MLFAGLGSVRMVKNCDLGPENATLGLRPRAAFSSPRSQFFTIRTSQPANNIYIFHVRVYRECGASVKPYGTPPNKRMNETITAEHDGAMINLSGTFRSRPL